MEIKSSSTIRYPVIVSRTSDNCFSARAIDIDKCEETAEDFYEVIERIKNKIQDMTWMLGNTNSEIPKPSSFESTKKVITQDELLMFVDVLSQYSEHPKILYLYYPVNEHLLAMLLDPYVFFSDPSNYNDPFERPDVLEENWTPKEEIKEVAFQMSLEETKKECWTKGYKTAEDFIIAAKFQDPPFIEVLTSRKKQSLDFAADNYLAACYSRKFDNTLMWSHYSDKHKGIVIGYDFDEINTSAFRSSDIDYRIHKGKLRAGQFAGAPTDFDSEPYVSRKLFSKHPMWSYEQEYRLLRKKDKKDNEVQQGYKHSVSKDCIKELYLGCNMPEETKRHISQILGGRKIDIYEMYTGENSQLKYKAFAQKEGSKLGDH